MELKCDSRGCIEWVWSCKENEYLHHVGFGAYHSLVQIYSVEYTIGVGSGIFYYEERSVLSL